MVKTLDERIREDLKDLYNDGKMNGIIDAAVKLNDVIKDKLSTKGLPGYFTGNRNAQTVLVMLNPGQDASVSDNPLTLQEEIKKLKIKTGDFEEFVDSFMTGKAKFGKLTTNKKDPFDLKQAEFLRDWDSELKIPKDFPADKDTYEKATEEVLMNKLQLELIPYCSRKFVLKSKLTDKEKAFLLSYVDTLFEEIFSKKRTYVIFASAVFEKIFKMLPNVKFEEPKSPREPLKKKDGESSKINFRCQKITITYKGKEHKAMIAHTYPVQFHGDIICQYGKFCYEEYIKS